MPDILRIQLRPSWAGLRGCMSYHRLLVETRVTTKHPGVATASENTSAGGADLPGVTRQHRDTWGQRSHSSGLRACTWARGTARCRETRFRTYGAGSQRTENSPSHQMSQTVLRKCVSWSKRDFLHDKNIVFNEAYTNLSAVYILLTTLL